MVKRYVFQVEPTCWGLFADSTTSRCVLGSGGVWWDVGKAAGHRARRLCCVLKLPCINFLQRAEELSQIVRIIVCAGHQGD